MLIWIFVDNIIAKAAIQVFEHLGFDIHGNFFNDTPFGGSREIVIALIATSFIKIFIPAVYMKKMLLNLIQKCGK